MKVFARADAGEFALTGDGGFVPEMIKALLERGLAAEQTAHLGSRRTSAAAPGRLVEGAVVHGWKQALERSRWPTPNASTPTT